MSSRDKVRTLRGRVAVVGIGETTYYKHGQSPDAEFKLALKAILAACADAGLDPRRIDGAAGRRPVDGGGDGRGKRIHGARYGWASRLTALARGASHHSARSPPKICSSAEVPTRRRWNRRSRRAVPDCPPMVADSGRYGRSFADVYDEWYADAPTDALVEFVRARVAPGSDVLELGIGTGRVALALAAAGYRVTGIDSSPEMLDRLAAKPGAAAVAAILGDAADAAVYPSSGVDAVLAVFNLLFNLTGGDDQRRCLAAAAGALTPGGILVVEAFVPDPITERRRELVTRSVDGARVVLIATDADPDEQTIDGGHIEITEHGTRLRPWRIRVTTPAGIDAMAAEAGLQLVERFEDLAGTPFVDGESSHHVSVYRLAPPGV